MNTSVNIDIKEFDELRNHSELFKQIQALCKHLTIKETDKTRPDERLFANGGGQEYLGLNYRQMEILLIKIRKLV